jgi:hypothetical protein
MAQLISILPVGVGTSHSWTMRVTYARIRIPKLWISRILVEISTSQSMRNPDKSVMQILEIRE